MSLFLKLLAYLSVFFFSFQIVNSFALTNKGLGEVLNPTYKKKGDSSKKSKNRTYKCYCNDWYTTDVKANSEIMAHKACYPECTKRWPVSKNGPQHTKVKEK